MLKRKISEEEKIHFENSLEFNSDYNEGQGKHFLRLNLSERDFENALDRTPYEYDLWSEHYDESHEDVFRAYACFEKGKETEIRIDAYNPDYIDGFWEYAVSLTGEEMQSLNKELERILNKRNLEFSDFFRKDGIDFYGIDFSDTKFTEKKKVEINGKSEWGYYIKAEKEIFDKILERANFVNITIENPEKCKAFVTTNADLYIQDDKKMKNVPLKEKEIKTLLDKIEDIEIKKTRNGNER